MRITEDQVYSKSRKKEISKVTLKRKDGKVVSVWPWTIAGPMIHGLKKPIKGR